VTISLAVQIFIYIFIIVFTSCSATYAIAFNRGIRSGYDQGRADGMRLGNIRG